MLKFRYRNQLARFGVLMFLAISHASAAFDLAVSYTNKPSPYDIPRAQKIRQNLWLYIVMNLSSLAVLIIWCKPFPRYSGSQAVPVELYGKSRRYSGLQDTKVDANEGSSTPDSKARSKTNKLTDTVEPPPPYSASEKNPKPLDPVAGAVCIQERLLQGLQANRVEGIERERPEYDVVLYRGLSSILPDFYKKGIESVAGCHLSWWPLSEPEEELKPRHTRVYSVLFETNERQFYDDIPTELAEEIFPRLPHARASATKSRWAALNREGVVLRGTTLMRLLYRFGDVTGTSPKHHKPEGQRLRGPQGIHSSLASQQQTQAASEPGDRCGPTWNGQGRAKIATKKESDGPILFISAEIKSNESLACAVDLGDDDKVTFQNARAAYGSLPSWGWKRATGIRFYRVMNPLHSYMA